MSKDMPILTIVGNWKMNTTPSSASCLAADIRERLTNRGGASVVVCPPSIALHSVRSALEGSDIGVGAQNIHWEREGAFTGEMSADMARELAEYVIVGHSERRAMFGESDEIVGKKAAAAVSAGLRPILCVGESAAERRAGSAEPAVVSQLDAGLAGVDDATGILVAYEPVWAIGSGEAATPDVAQRMARAIKAALEARFGDAAKRTPCLYGGSVSADNIAGFIAQPDIDGALVGGASLSADSFALIVENAAAAIRAVES